MPLGLVVAAFLVVLASAVSIKRKRGDTTPVDADLHADKTPLPFISILIPPQRRTRYLESIRSARALDYPANRLEIIVAADPSDGTDLLAQRLAGIRVCTVPNGANKREVLSRLISHARGNFLLITDSRRVIRPDALRKLVPSLRKPGDGMAVAKYDPASDSATNWRFDSIAGEHELERDMVMGAHGAGYSVRRDLFPEIAGESGSSDIMIPMLSRSHGFRVMVRVPRGDHAMLRRYRHLLSPKPTRLWWSVRAHRLLKVSEPVLLTALVALLGFLVYRAVSQWEGVSPVWVGAAAICGFVLPIAVFGSRAVALVRAVGFSLIALGTYVAFPPSERWIGGATSGRAVESDTWFDLDVPANFPLRVRLFKRCLDLFGAIVGLTLLWPLMAVIAVAVKLESRGPIFFRQERVAGVKDGHEVLFRMVKFRTMRQDAESSTGPVWASEQDPRVTRVGGFLRKTRLDEIPQLWNVLKGEMSLVGPRPERPFFTHDLKHLIPGYEDRVIALRPGITGWAQVKCSYDTSVDSVRTKLLYDLSYAGHLYRLSSYIRMEIRVLTETVLVVITGRGAH